MLLLCVSCTFTCIDIKLVVTYMQVACKQQIQADLQLTFNFCLSRRFLVNTNTIAQISLQVTFMRV